MAFAGSCLLHCALLATLALWSVKAPNDDSVGHVRRKYSVRFLRLQMPRESRERAGSRMGAGASAVRKSGTLQSPARGTENSESGAAEALTRAQPITREHRLFELPPTAHVDPVKQTLVQLDLPPDIVLKHEIPIPTALLWTQNKMPPPMRKQFVAPPLKQVVKPAQSLPVPAMLTPPNLEMSVADLNIGAAFLNDTPRLVRPQAVATPVSRPAPELAKEIPQVALADSSESIPANVISLPDAPLRSSTMIVLPPVNQIAPSAAGNGGGGRAAAAADGTQGSGDQGQGRGASGSGGAGTEAAGNGGKAAGAQGLGGGGTGGDSESAGSGAGTAASGAGAGGSGTGESKSGSGAGRSSGTGGSSGSGGSGAADGSGDTLPSSIAGVTRLTLPKDGRYGVVVAGSAPGAPYPESVGALGGKMVYTVYLKVGLRKSWILQYCLPKTAELRITTRGSATPLDAPWPFLILRPDRFSSTGEDYVMVHGMITAEGQFDQLAMVYPEQLEKKDLLISSLSKWEFRPASRDGVRTTVEILLIIPREPD